MDEDRSPAKLWNIGFIYLLVVNSFNSIAFGMIAPLLPGYLVSMGATLAFSGLATGVFSVTALFVRPMAGILGDRLNKKKLLIITMSLTGLSITLYSLIPAAVWMIPVRILHGVVFSLSGTLFIALGADYIPQNRLGEGVGFLSVGQILGMALGPNIAIDFMERFSYELCFIFSGTIILISGLSLIALRYDRPVTIKPENKSKRAFHLSEFVAKELLPNMFFGAVFIVSNGLLNSYLVLMGIERGINSIGLFFIVNAVVLLFARPFIGRLTDRKGVAYAAFPGYILAAATMMIIGFSHTLWPILIAAVFAAVGVGGALPALQADCFRILGSQRKTVATGTYMIGMDLGMTIGQVLGGVVIGSAGFTVAFGGAGILMLIGFVLYLIYHRLAKPPCL